MIEAKINLLALVLNHKYNSYQILSTSSTELNFPYIDLEPYIDLKQSLEFILTKISNDNNIIPNFKLTDVTMLDQLNIYYLSFIHNDIELNNTYHLLDINSHIERIPDNAKKIITLL
jgi:hypothetical protein